MVPVDEDEGPVAPGDVAKSEDVAKSDDDDDLSSFGPSARVCCFSCLWEVWLGFSTGKAIGLKFAGSGHSMLPLENAAVAAQVGGGCLVGPSPRQLVRVGNANAVASEVLHPCTDSRSKQPRDDSGVDVG